MTPRRTIKARMHHGANSLDLTVPTEIRREHGIEAGDVFTVTVAAHDGEFVIEYRRVYPKPPVPSNGDRNGDGSRRPTDHSGNTRV